jgi:hypothetical protein
MLGETVLMLLAANLKWLTLLGLGSAPACSTWLATGTRLTPVPVAHNNHAMRNTSVSRRINLPQQTQRHAYDGSRTSAMLPLCMKSDH